MLGDPVDTSTPCTAPTRHSIQGKLITLVPFVSSHAHELWPSISGPSSEESIWKYWPVGPFASAEEYDSEMSFAYDKSDPLFWAIIDPETGKCEGQAILGEVDVGHRNIEAGMFLGEKLQKTAKATEAFYLIADLAFGSGFRRLAWKTSAENWASRRAAERYGLSLEGIWRQHKIEKGRNRDSAWFSVIDKEWPVRKLAFEKWLDPSNFDEEGKQKESLVAIRSRLEAEGGS